MITRPDEARTDTTEVLQRLWQSVLNLDGATVSAQSHFAELGGDSIAATVCLNLIRREFGCRITIAEFMAPETTLGRLALLIDRRRPA